jgi:hypothetical protein
MVRDEIPQSDYTAFLALFSNGMLTLTNGMQVEPRVRRVISHVSDECLAHDVCTMPGGVVTLTNLDEVLRHQSRYVKLLASDGILTLPAYKFLLLQREDQLR